MVRLIIGTQGSGKSTKLCEMIKNEIENSDKEVILIVPEQQSVTWTAKMSALLPPSANRRFTTTTFTFLPNDIFRIYGGLSDTVVDEGTRSLIVWRAMLAVKEFLKVYKAGDNGREERAVPYLMDAIEEFRQSGVSPADAEKALCELEKDQESDENAKISPDLIARLSDAVHVYGAYTAILHESFVDKGDVLDNLAKTLQEHHYFTGKSVYLDSFFSLSSHEEKILKLIIEQADDVTVTCACPVNMDERGCPIVFDDVDEFRARTEALAKEVGKKCEHINMEENIRHRGKDEFLLTDRDLFSTRTIEIDETKEPSKESENIKIIKCGDKFDEAEACASVISSLLRQGYKYSDIGVIARNIGTREGILDNTLRRHGIKCFISESTEVSSSPAVKLVLAALGVAAGGWKRRDIIRLYKTGMTPCGRGTKPGFDSLEGDVFENYTYTWNIRGRKMYTAEEWTMNPDGYTDQNNETGKEILKLANSAKNKIIPPLDKLLSVFGDSDGVAPVRNIAEKIYYFAEDYSVDVVLNEMAESYEALGMLRDADRTRKSWNYVTEILEKMVSVIGDTPLNVVRFARLFASVASGMDKGTIPTGVDEVVLGSSSGIRLESVKCAILIGSVNDEFPAPIDDSAHFFDDSDRQILENYDITLCSPTKDISLSREYFMYYRSVLCATDKLYILAPTGSGAELSDPAKRIADILAEQDIKCVDTFAKMPLEKILYDRITAEYLISRRGDTDDIMTLRSILGEEKQTVSLTAKNDMIPPRTGQTSMALSNSAIESYVKCPFSYCCDRVLKLKPANKAEINPADIGKFIHSVFEHFFAEVSVESIRDGLENDEIKALAERIVSDYIASLAETSGTVKTDYNGRMDYLMERIKKYVVVFIERMTEDFRQSQFVPRSFELPIGLKKEGMESVDPLKFKTQSGVEVYLNGIADRVDTYKSPDGHTYIRIVDYKTGKKNFDINKLSNGIDMQMLIYLFSILKFGIPGDGQVEYLPAGVEYIRIYPDAVRFPTLTNEDTVREGIAALVETSGIFLNNADVINAMDNGISGEYINISQKDGVLKEPRSKTYVRSEEEFDEIKSGLETTVVGIASKILDGHAEADPTQILSDSPCIYCKFAYVCKSKKG